MKKGVIFDVDGTLFETGDGIKYCADYVLQSLNVPRLSEDKLNSFIGPSLFYSFTQTVGLDEQTALHAVELYRARYKDVILDMSRPYDGIEDMLSALYADGYMLAVASSKPLVMVQKLLDKYGVTKYFTRVCAPDYARRGSEKAALITEAAGGCDSLMVGDTKFDIDGAHEAGYAAIAVTYGYGERSTLTSAEYFADTPQQVLQTAKRHFNQ